MVTNDEGIVHFKHSIMEEVCRLAWDSNLNEDTKAALMEQLEKAFRDAILKESDKGQLDEEALGRKIRKEALRTVEYMAADGVIGEGIKDSDKYGDD